MRVVLKKIKAQENALCPTPLAKDYFFGSDNGRNSVPLDYTVEGHIDEFPVVGKPVFMNREKRNGVEVPGLFMTSTITEIEGNLLHTANSVYIIEIL